MQRAALLRPLVGSPLLPASPLAARRRRRFCGGFRVRSAAGEGGSGPGGGGGIGEGDGAAASWLSSAVGENVDELLQREENRAVLKGVEDAELRVERARAALADIERQEAAARFAREEVRRLEKRRDEVCCYPQSQRELLQAREMIDEAQRSLSSSLEEGSFGDVSSGDIDEDSERLESAKAAAVSSIVGVLASLPISFYEAQDLPQLFLQSSVVFISCALFGVTFRYAVRRDLDNIQLKTGAPAAFAFVRGLALLESGRTLELSTDTLISVALDGAAFDLILLNADGSLKLNADTAIVFAEALVLMSDGSETSDEQPSASAGRGRQCNSPHSARSLVPSTFPRIPSPRGTGASMEPSAVRTRGGRRGGVAELCGGEKVDEIMRSENRSLLEAVKEAERRVERTRPDIECQEAAARAPRRPAASRSGATRYADVQRVTHLLAASSMFDILPTQ
ncbi:hypothetical protein BAE44_0019210 [Dichanthelium oligosanthes]|uniref:Uncharacterized protein n=1 Tax=Dichanthelium oligosanthes TaxID=888268 RepID=A0A1E5V3P9_9POAL|nr:hypothetical protein BAE44_0019210 [Dichanthelium oligosanthes]